MQTLIERYKKVLFTYPDAEISYHSYAIVDSIRDEEIREKLIFSELAYTDLWDESLHENPEEVPLYLIALEQEDSLTPWLLSRHDKGAILYLQSNYDLESLRAHYSGYTFPYMEMEAKGYEKEIPRGIFGFYDPLIFPRFMQTLYSEEKRERFFAGASLFVVPSTKSHTLCNFYYLNHDCHIALKPWQTDKTPPTIDKKKYYNNPIDPTYAVHTIDKRQIEILEGLAHERFVKEVLEALDAQEILDNKEKIDKVTQRSLWAKEHLGIDSQANMARFIHISLMLPKPLENYTQSSEFKALTETQEQLEKREILQTLMKKLDLREVA